MMVWICILRGNPFVNKILERPPAPATISLVAAVKDILRGGANGFIIYRAPAPLKGTDSREIPGAAAYPLILYRCSHHPFFSSQNRALSFEHEGTVTAGNSLRRRAASKFRD